MTAKRRRFQGKSHIDFTKNGRVIPYREQYFKLPPRERPRINEKAILGVIQLSKEVTREDKFCFVAPSGARAFLEGRLRRLIEDTKNGPFTKAANRFRDAVRGFRAERPGFYLSSDILMVKTIPPPSARFAHPRSHLKHAPAIPRHLIDATLPESAYEPEDGEDLLFIPEWLDRKAEVPLDHPLRKRTKSKAYAA